MKKVIMFIILYSMFFSLLAQEVSDLGSFAIILHAQGSELNLFHDNGESKSYNVSYAKGLVLLDGDIIQTDSSTFLEIQFFPSKNIVKLAENTVFAINKIDNFGGGEFELMYGRMLIQLSHVNDESQFIINSYNTVFEVDGRARCGIDYLTSLTEVNNEVMYEAYCFEGNGKIATTTDPFVDRVNNDDVMDFPISSNQMVEVGFVIEQESHGRLIHKASISNAVTNYWEQYAIQSQPFTTVTIKEEFKNIGQIISDRQELLPSGQLGIFSSDDVHSTSQTSGYPTFNIINAVNLMKNFSEPQMYRAKPLGILGGVISILGTLTGIVGGIILSQQNSETLGLDPMTAVTLSTGLMIGGGSGLGLGIIFLLIDGS